MKKITAIALLTSSLSTLTLAQDTSNPYDSNRFTGSINGYMGIKGLDEDEWAPVDSHTAFGISADLGMSNWPINVTLAYIASSSGEEDIVDPNIGIFEAKLSTREMRFGIKYIAQPNTNIKAFFSGGIANVNSTIELGASITNNGFKSPPIESNDSATGFWVGLGANWIVAEHFSVGGEISYTLAEIDIGDEDANIGGAHLGLTLGFHW